MRKQYFIPLVDKYLSGQASAAERALVEAYLERLERDNVGLPRGDALERERNIWARVALATIQNEITQRPRVHRIHFVRRWWWAAASVMLLVSIGAYLWISNQKERPLLTSTQQVPSQQDVAPGRDGAILTLADGTNVVLDSMENGIIARQGGAQVVLKDGQLAYDPSGKSAEKVAYNTMSTPKGRQFKVTLPDGTKVWLNAASSITYPTAFVNHGREVSITGEAYFEVEKNASKPFVVKTTKEEITVLGTSFNVNAYTDEQGTKTSLLQGSVGINKTILQPGQAYINGKVITTNVQQDVAWKNGVFDFNNIGLKEAMRQISRWYNVEVEYKSVPKDISFFGEIKRNVPLSTVLIALRDAGVKFEIEGNKVIVQ